MAGRDAAATRTRILAAAEAEFAEHGLAGARTDRIAVRGDTNKAQLYHYFGSKDALFDVVFGSRVRMNIDRLPIDVDDLPGWSTRLYDYYLADPTLVRLATWVRLERMPIGDLYAAHGGIDEAVLRAVEQAQKAGVLRSEYEPVDLFCLVVAMAGTWAQASINVTAAPSDPRATHERRKGALARAIRSAFVVG